MPAARRILIEEPSMSDALFFRRQAETERANADAAVLENVRERCARAARSWDAMAARAERTDTLRREREAASRAALAD